FQHWGVRKRGWSIGATRRFRGLLRGDAALAELPISRRHWQDRPNTACLVSSSCSSAPAFAPRLLSDLPSRLGPCASLSLHLHLVLKRTYTSQLSTLLATQ